MLLSEDDRPGMQPTIQVRSARKSDPARGAWPECAPAPAVKLAEIALQKRGISKRYDRSCAIARRRDGAGCRALGSYGPGRTANLRRAGTQKSSTLIGETQSDLRAELERLSRDGDRVLRTTVAQVIEPAVMIIGRSGRVIS